MQVNIEHDLNLFILKEPDTNKLAEAAAKIAFHNFQWRYITLVVFNATLFGGVERFLTLYDKSYIVGKGLFYTPYAQTTRQYVMFGTDMENIAQMLDWMSLHFFDNTGKFIVICQSKVSRKCDVTEALEIFWMHKMTSIIFLKFEDSKVVGYTSQYINENCTFGKPKKVICPETSEQPCFAKFPEKFKNLQYCPLVVSTFIQLPFMYIKNGVPRGTDGDFVQLIAERLNATLIMMTPRHGNGWGRLEDNGSWSGSLGDLLDDTAHVSMTSASITLSRFSHFQMSVSYYRSQIAYFMHIAPMKPSSLKLLHPFQVPSQIVIAVTFILLILFIWLANSKYFNKNGLSHRTSSTQDVIFYLWMTYLGLPITKLPKKRAFVILTLSWIWYCYLIRTLYQAYLISSLQGNFYYDDINSLEDAYNANYSFGGGGALRDYYIDDPLIYDNWVVLETDEIIPTLFEIAKGKRFVLAMNTETAKILIKEHKLLLHVLSERLITSPSVLFYKKFSPLAKATDIVLQRLVETGFAKKCYKDNAEPISIKRDDNKNEPIKLEHYTGCYVILIAAWLTSVLAFFIEICYKDIQDKILHQQKSIN
ncbi:unnamed protein product [Diatraea saccharalis]|uniref:Uncharacterized protein n=1 Tax=Diatraea saccharalis TaxID=40085 RepID=A0A9N9REB6_9NEOP|nr:unnamed protein product [Diatraea saccharalis]